LLLRATTSFQPMEVERGEEVLGFESGAWPWIRNTEGNRAGRRWTTDRESLEITKLLAESHRQREKTRMNLIAKRLKAGIVQQLPFSLE